MWAFGMHGLGINGKIIRLGKLERIMTKLERDASLTATGVLDLNGSCTSLVQYNRP